MLRLVLQRLSQPSSSSSSLLLQAVQQPPLSRTSVLAGLWSSSSSMFGNQQLHSLAPAPSRMQQQHSSLPLLQQPQQRTFASSSLPSMQQLQRQPHKHKQQRPFFWNGLSSKIQSRKPAIKRPARHQWHYCNPDYDPMEPLPQQYLPPYAPERAHTKDYGAIFAAGMPKHNRNRYRRMWAKNMALADQRWREKWERRLAERRKAMAKVERISDRIKRQRSWEAWQANKLLAAEHEQQQRQQLGGGEHARLLEGDGAQAQVQTSVGATPAVE